MSYPDTNKGLKYFDEIVDDLDYVIKNYADKSGFDKLMTEMAANWQKADGGAFALQYLKKQGDNFISQVVEFESFYLSGVRFEADIRLTDKLVELKSWSKDTWSNLGTGSNLEQLKGYIRSNDNFIYIANRTKLINDGVTNPDLFVKEQFQNVFKKDADELFDLMSPSLKNTLRVAEDAIRLTDSQLNNLLNMIIKVE